MNAETNAAISPQYLNDIERDRQADLRPHHPTVSPRRCRRDPDYLFFPPAPYPTNFGGRCDPREVVEFFQAFRAFEVRTRNGALFARPDR